jgi:hypothetical protein
MVAKHMLETKLMVVDVDAILDKVADNTWRRMKDEGQGLG